MSKQLSFAGVEVEPVVYPEGRMSPAKKKRKPTRPHGYAALPGTGPEGETCGSCAHHCRIQFSKVYHKCGRVRHLWTGGPGTDILVRSPACNQWEAGEGSDLSAIR
jgi:hypothetical protein